MALGLIGAGLGLAGSLFGASKAADAQNNATRRQIKFLKQSRELDQQNTQPYLDFGNSAINPLAYELGLAEKPAGYDGYSVTPHAEYLLTEGRGAIEGGAAGAGNLFSGATAQALDRHRMGVIAGDRDAYLNRLTGVVGIGQAAAAGAAQQNQFYGTQLGNAAASQGNVQASLGIAQGNALTNFSDNMMKYYGYAKGLQ